jgi:N-acetylglucosamine kinase-like BadF-type ATPase
LPSQVLPELPGEALTKIFFYGAGCGTELRREIIRKALHQNFPGAPVIVETDLTGAAHAMLGDEPGMVVILGTGTNSGIYDGKRIVTTIDSLGYILGDEGSGAAIGRKMVRDYLRNYFPSPLGDLFKEEFPFTRDQVLDRLYYQPFPSRFLAQWVKFAARHIQQSYIQSIVQESFKELFQQLIVHYDAYRQYPFNCCGSVGYIFKEILEATAVQFGITPGRILASPIDDLLAWHLKSSSK